MKLKSIKFICAIVLLYSIQSGCNPVSENVDKPQWNSLHNAKPFKSEYYHNSNYRFPENSCDEVQCHGAGLSGGNSGAPSCFSCHDNQWSVYSISHTKSISGFYHRSNVDNYPSDRSTNTGWYSECKTCHGSTLAGTQGGPSANFAYRYSCTECHTAFLPNTIPPPGHSSRKSDGGVTGWHHYNYESGSSATYCSGAACHGGDGQSVGTAVTSLTGLAGHGPACSDCHD